MSNSFYSTLPADIQRQLKLCGVTSDKQLAAGIAPTIYQELKAAANFFPGETISLTEAQISELIRKAADFTGISVKDTAPTLLKEKTPAPPVIHSVVKIQAPKDDEAEELPSIKNTAFQKHLKSANHYKSEGKAITSGHPVALWFGALACSLVPLFLITLISSPFILLQSGFSAVENIDLIYAVLIVALILPHLIMVRLVHCSVCHMNLFTFRNYPYHSKAHRLPLLGVPVSTALRILFTFHFTCPACGTKQKLFGKHKRHHSRRH